MLVLTRFVGEEVLVACPDGTKIVVRVVDIGGGRCRLGFEAPKSVEIMRSELTYGHAPDQKKAVRP